ncbi:MAG: hypothetical protein QM811_19500 [Pirellulales bacterium]
MTLHYRRWLALICWASLGVSRLHAETPDATPLAVVAPATAGCDADVLATMREPIDAAIAAGEMPGCVVCIGRSGKIVWLRATAIARSSRNASP